MRTFVLISALLVAVSLAKPTDEEAGKFDKHCKKLRRRECRARAERCNQLLEPVGDALFEDFFTTCAVKLNIPKERRPFFLETLAAAFINGGRDIIKEMTTEDRDLFFKYQHCVFSSDGLINQDGMPNIHVLKSRLEKGIKEQLASQTPEFQEEILQALNACPAKALNENLTDCLMPPCIKNLDSTELNPKSPTA